MFDIKYFLSLSLPLAVLVIYTITLRQHSGLVTLSRSVSSSPPRGPPKAVSQNKISTDDIASSYELFLLEKWCSVRCEAHVARELREKFRCTNITILPVLRSVQARCNAIRSMTPEQVKENVVKKITGVKGYVNNLKLPSASIGERVHVRSISTLPPGQAKQSSFVSRLIQSIAGMLPWGLDRIDQSTGEDGKFDLSCFPNLGEGVTVYVLDTGCRDTHDDLKGRTRIEKVGRYKTGKDDHGHGTHIAGTAAGTNYGVCKRCNIICIKTLDENNVGTLVDVVDAVEYVLEQKKASPDTPAVAVMSLGGPLETNILDLAVNKLAKAKVFPAVSAGNGFTDACEWTPPRAEHAVTVGATMQNDELRFSSNYGNCVKIVAPGEEVRSASHQGDSLYVTMSGTSMAAPYVAGVAGLILGEDGELTPAQVLEKMKLKAKIVDDELNESTYPLLRVLRNNCELYGFSDLESLPSTSPSVSTTPSPSASLSASPSSTVSTSPTPSLSTSPMPSPSASLSPSMTTSSTPSASMSSSPSLSTSPTSSMSTSPMPSILMSSTPSASTSPTPSISISSTPSATTSSTASFSASLMPSISASSTTSPSALPSPSTSNSPIPSMSASPMPSALKSVATSPSPATTTSSTYSAFPSRMPSPSVSPIPMISFSQTPCSSVAPIPSPSAYASHPSSFSQTPIPFAPAHSSTSSESPSASASPTQSISGPRSLPRSSEESGPSPLSTPSTPPSQGISSFAPRIPSPSLVPFDIEPTPTASTFLTPLPRETGMVTVTPSQTYSESPSASLTASPTFFHGFQSSPESPHDEFVPSPSRKPLSGSMGLSASASPYRFIADAIL